MAEIKLKAILRAYSKIPFYNDFARDVYSQEDTKPDTQYVRVYHEVLDDEGNIVSGSYTGEWAALDTSLLEQSLDAYKQQVEDLETSVENIKIGVDYANSNLIFTKYVDGKEIITHIPLPAANPDGITINQNEQGQLYAVDTPDESTLKEVDVVYETVDEEGNPTTDVYNINSKKISGKLRVVGVYIEDAKKTLSGSELNDRLVKAEKNIKDLEAYTQGTGGHLDPVNLGLLYRTNPDEEGYDAAKAAARNSVLNIYAYSQLNADGSEYATRIPNQTKVQNTYDGILWVYVEGETADASYWLNSGTDVVVVANNDGVLGVVTGSYERLKGKIGADGTITINGLDEIDSTMITEYNISVDPLNGKIAKRTEKGQVKTTSPEAEDDSVNLKYLEDWYASNKIVESEISALFGGN